MTFTTSCQNPNFPTTPIMTLSYIQNEYNDTNDNVNNFTINWSFS